MELSEYKEGRIHIIDLAMNGLMIFLLVQKSVMQKLAISVNCPFQSNTYMITECKNDRPFVKYSNHLRIYKYVRQVSCLIQAHVDFDMSNSVSN